jgi:general stress protein 26
VVDGEIWFETKAKSQKVQNLKRDPRISALVEAGHTYDQLRGV